MSIGKNIARFRKAKGLTQAELGDLLGVSNQAVSKWESEITMPDVMLLPKIAKELQIAIDDLYEEINDEAFFDYKASKISSERSDQEERKILLISVENKDAVVRTRVPVKAIRLLFNNKEAIDVADFEENELAMINEALDSNGTIVYVNKEDKKVKISVEDYEAQVL